MRLLREWREPNIELAHWGSDYLERYAGGSHPPLWNGKMRQTRSVRLRWSAQLLWMMIRRRQHYDLVHIHILWWGGLLAPLLARLLGKKAIYSMTLQGSDTPGPVAAQPLGRLKLALFKQYHGVIGLAPALIDDCRRHSFASDLLVLPGFLVFDPPTLPDTARRERARRRLGIPEHAQVLLFAGSIISRKGVDLLVDLFVKLAGQRTDLWLLLVGPHTHAENPRLDEAFVAAQRDTLEQAGLGERVTWTGLVRDDAEFVDTYLASDLFIFPTRAEGMPNVMIAAMGCGLPIVCSHLPGITDMMVVPDETGYLANADDLDGFAAATTRLLDDPTLCRRMGAAGQKRAIADFGFDAYCHNLAHFYQLVATKQVEVYPDIANTPEQQGGDGTARAGRGQSS